MPILEFEVPSLNPSAEWLLNNCPFIKEYYEENMMDGVSPNLLVGEALDAYMDYGTFNEDKLALMVCWSHYNLKLLSRKKVSQAIHKSDKRTFYLVTFTSDPGKSEDDNRLDITRYRQSHFKKYKHVWVEEKESAESQKYHQHVLIECPMKVVRRDQNLKPAAYYKAHVNVRKATPTKSSIDRIILDYFSKENKPKGDLDYFLKLQF